MAADDRGGKLAALLQELEVTSGFVLSIGRAADEWLEPLAERGLETAVLDLEPSELTAARLRARLDGRPVAALLALDVLDQTPEPVAMLRELEPVLRETGAPLVLSVANLARFDIAARLVFGRFERSATRPQFTAACLDQAIGEAGLCPVGRRDVTISATADGAEFDPTLSPRSPVAQMLRRWRGLADEHGDAATLLRAVVPAPDAAGAGTAEPGREADEVAIRRLTVLLRTQGRRRHGLREALLCLAAQTVDMFDVDLLVHTDQAAEVELARSIVAEFHHTFSSRVSVVHVPEGGGRSRPLNVGLERLHADYVAFLDDDDLVAADWVEGFLSVADGVSVARQGSAVRAIGPAPAPEAPYLVRSGLEFPFAQRFDLAMHLARNHTPICAFAVPRGLIDTFALRFSETHAVLEDWDLLLRCSQLTAVRDSGRLTSIVQLWDEGDSSRSVHSEEIWEETEDSVQQRLDAGPLLLPAGSVHTLVKDHRELERLRSELEEFPLIYYERAAYRDEAEKMRGEVYYFRHHAEQLRARLARIEGSRWWRMHVRAERAAAALRRRTP